MRTLVAMAMFAAFGCTLDVDREVGVPEVTHTTVEIKEVPLPYIRPLDVLFVVDSAPTMDGEQSSLASNARDFVRQLDFAVGLPDIHIAVVDSDLGTRLDIGDPRCDGSGDDGLPSTYACGVAGDFISHERGMWGEATANFSGELADAFTCIITSVGANGCPFRQPLEAMRRGLAHGKRTGFLREEAKLLVVFLGDADDCSAADAGLHDPASSPLSPRDPFRCFVSGVVCDGPDDPYATGPRTGCRPRETGSLRSIGAYEEGLRALKEEDWRDIFVAAITPAGEIVVEPGPRLGDGCSDRSNAGTPAIRMRAFVERFANHYTYASICADDWSGVLSSASFFLQFRRITTAAEDAGRVQRHLAAVESDLRSAGVGHLSADQHAARIRNLDQLERYRMAGAFPLNYGELEHAGPFFIDQHGTRCAMANLIEEAGGGALVGEVATTRNGAYIRELAAEPALVSWLERNGLTLEDAARIQPEYHHIGYPCIEGVPVDGDAVAPGLQAVTAVSVVSASDRDDPVDYAIAPCDGVGPRPCYRMMPDALNCAGTPTGLGFTLEPTYLGFPAYLQAQILVE